MDELKFVDTTIWDGPQSLWSMKMRTNMMLRLRQSSTKRASKLLRSWPLLSSRNACAT